MRTHDTEFDPSYACPPKPAGFMDSSWHNEACPSYALPVDGMCEIRLWIQHPDPTKREMDCGPRFIVGLDDQDSTLVDLVITDNFDLAVACCLLAKTLVLRSMSHEMIVDILKPFNDEVSND